MSVHWIPMSSGDWRAVGKVYEPMPSNKVDGTTITFLIPVSGPEPEQSAFDWLYERYRQHRSRFGGHIFPRHLLGFEILKPWQRVIA